MFANPYSAYPFMGAQMGPQMAQNNPFIPAMQQPQPAQNDGAVVLYAPTAKEFSNVTVQPGRRALVISQNDPFIAFKVADSNGMVETSLYRLEPVTQDQVNGPAVEYATREEFAKLEAIVNKIVDGLAPKTGKEASA